MWFLHVFKFLFIGIRGSNKFCNSSFQSNWNKLLKWAKRGGKKDTQFHPCKCRYLLILATVFIFLFFGQYVRISDSKCDLTIGWKWQCFSDDAILFLLFFLPPYCWFSSADVICVTLRVQTIKIMEWLDDRKEFIRFAWPLNWLMVYHFRKKEKNLHTKPFGMII